VIQKPEMHGSTTRESDAGLKLWSMRRLNPTSTVPVFAKVAG